MVYFLEWKEGFKGCMMKTLVCVNGFYPEEIRRRGEVEKYRFRGTCAVSLIVGTIEMFVRNITYRIDHDGRVSLKPPFRVHSNKKAGIKPKLVPSIVFKEPEIWVEIEKTIKSELSKKDLCGNARENEGNSVGFLGVTFATKL